MYVSRRARASASLLAALVAVLALAAAASAETRIGESTDAITEGTPTPELTAVKATASYDTAGSITVTLTTAGPPQELLGGKPNTAAIRAKLFKASQCDLSGVGTFSLPEAIIESFYGESTVFFSGARGLSIGEQVVPATKTVSGTTTTLSMSAGVLANLSFNCALVGAEIQNEHQETEAGSVMLFPLKAPVIPPAPASSGSTSTPPASGPPTPPAGLSIAKPKPVEAKVGKWKTVKVKVANTGGTTTAPGSLRVKPAKGVIVKPKSQKLPELAPGTSWTMSVRVQVTEKAKQKSTLSISAAASGVTAKGSLIVYSGR